MASDHDSNIALDPRGAMDEKERWSKAEWEHYELWEKIELRLRRRKWLWITAAVIVFLGLSSIPIILDRWPKWVNLVAIRRLSQEINEIKRQVAVEHQAFRIRFTSDEPLKFVVERAARCSSFTSDSQASGEWVRDGQLLRAPTAGEFWLMQGDKAVELGVPGLVASYCYDPFEGQAQEVVGFGLMPVKDLTEGRLDRVSILVLKGNSAEISFD